MGECTYNTDHGNFLLMKEHMSDALKILNEHVKMTPPADSLVEFLDLVGLDSAVNDEGDLIDIFLKGSHFEDHHKEILDLLSCYVEPNSYLVFAYGGAGGCWAIHWPYNGTSMEPRMAEEDVTTVLHCDMARLQEELPENHWFIKKYCFSRTDRLKETG